MLITENQHQVILQIIVKQLQVIEVYRDQIEYDQNDLGTIIEINTNHYRNLDNSLKSWKKDAIGTGLRQGIREIGRIIAQYVTHSELLDICDEACAQSPNADRSQAILNAAWSGLTTTDGQTWVA